MSSVKGESGDERHLPSVLERALNYKLERAKEMGIGVNDIARAESEGLAVARAAAPPPPIIRSAQFMPAVKRESDGETAEDTDESGRQIKKGRKKKKKKKRPSRHTVAHNGHNTDASDDTANNTDQLTDEDSVDVTYVSGLSAEEMADPLYRQFAHIFETFRIGDKNEADAGSTAASTTTLNEAASSTRTTGAAALAASQHLKKVPKMIETDDSDDDDEENANTAGRPKISKRKLRQMSRMSVAELKREVTRPDMVEMHDVTSKDPLLLMTLKSCRNSVPVPRHWCFKRKYLQGKRGIEKPPFELPEFIQRTGIMEMRQALQEKEDQKNLKAKMREKVRPKMGKIDIDYKKLHDAFFKWQTKPPMTIHGDLYYEGKEFETRLREKKPGDMSDEMRTALGMPVGPNNNKIPPPWLIAMQRYGPPPSYPNLRIAGLNAPIPEGCSFGYHAGGWGKPPVDQLGKPLYGDVFGVRAAEDEGNACAGDDIDRSLWGELESDSESDESDDSEGSEAGGDDARPTATAPDQSGLITPAEGVATPSGVASVTAGLETPEMIELRKKKIESEIEGGETPSALYHVLPERRQERVAGAGMMASTHTYDMSTSAATAATNAANAAAVGGVELALDPSELDLVDTDAMTQRYEQRLRETQLEKEDLSDMVAEHAVKQKNKRKRVQQQDEKKTKKYKEFKF